MAGDRASQNKGVSAVPVSAAFVGIAGGFVITRILTRVGLVRNAGADDILIVASLLCSIGLTVLIWAQYQHGLGRHFDTLEPGEFEQMGKPFWASIPIYNLGLTFTKLSLILQYLRVFVGKRIRLACWIMLGIIVVYGLWTLLGTLLSCLPIPYFWDKSINGHCMNLLAVWFSNASMNIATDLALYIMPMPVLNSLQLPRKQKYGLMLIFAVGLFAVITSILRLHSLYVVSVSTDITWDNVGAATWSSVELNVSIICACLPTLRPVLVRVFPVFFATTHASQTGGVSQTARSRQSRRHSRTFGTTSTSSVLKNNATMDHQAWEFEELGPMRDGKRVMVMGGGGSVRGEDEEGIKVTKTLRQEVERANLRESETSSERKLARPGTEMHV